MTKNCTIPSAAMDSTFLHAYNSCDMDKQSAIYGESLEFYHDKVLMTSKQRILDAGKKTSVAAKYQRTGKEVLKCILSRLWRRGNRVA
jgi:hypothetical protein